MPQENTTESKSFGGVSKAYVLMPYHIEWLRNKRQESKRPASLILRELIDQAIEAEKQAKLAS